MTEEHMVSRLRETAQMGRVYTPETAAERYGCSANHIRNLIKRGELRAFRLGPRLIRIPEDALEEYEQCQMKNTASEGSRADGLFPGGRREKGSAIVLRVPTDKAPNGKP